MNATVPCPECDEGSYHRWYCHPDKCILRGSAFGYGDHKNLHPTGRTVITLPYDIGDNEDARQFIDGAIMLRMGTAVAHWEAEADDDAVINWEEIAVTMVKATAEQWKGWGNT